MHAVSGKNHLKKVKTSRFYHATTHSRQTQSSNGFMKKKLNAQYVASLSNQRRSLRTSITLFTRSANTSTKTNTTMQTHQRVRATLFASTISLPVWLKVLPVMRTRTFIANIINNTTVLYLSQ